MEMMERKRVTIMDSIKGIAMIGIFMVHIGTWSSVVSQDSSLMRLILRGALGVELTYFVNAFFFTKGFVEQVNSQKTDLCEFIKRKLVSLIPIYWLTLILYAVVTYVTKGNVGGDLKSVVSCFLFLNALNPYCWNSFFPGSGYIGVLALMWLIYPLYLRKIKNIKNAILGAVTIIGVTYTLYILGLFLVEAYMLQDFSVWASWLGYIYRGVYSFALGTVLYYVNEEGVLNRVGNIQKWGLTVSEILMVFFGTLHNNAFDGLLFTILLLFVVAINMEKSIFLIDNAVFQVIGKHSMEVFVCHILLYYSLVHYFMVLPAGRKTFVIVLLLTIISAPCLKICTNKLVQLIRDKKNHRFAGIKCKEKSIYIIGIIFIAMIIITPIAYSVKASGEKEDIQTSVTVAQSGEGDFTTIADAINYFAGEEGTIVIYPGTYEEVINICNKKIALRGTDRDKCIIVNSTGQYGNAPITACGNFTLENLTIKMTLENVGDWEPTYDSSNVPTTYPGYALHIDAPNIDEGDEIQEARIINCICYSEAFPAVGLGINENQRIIFEDCEFIRNTIYENYRIDNCRGAFVGHASNRAVDNQYLVIEDCTFRSNYGYAAKFWMTLEGEKGAECLFVNNTFISDEMQTSECVEYIKGESKLDPLSRGNSAEILNAQ